jgi:ribonuclease R
VVAEVVGAGRGAAARTAFEAGRPIPLRRGGRTSVAVGDLVTVALRGRSAEVLERHGDASDPEAVIGAVVADAGLDRDFPRGVDEEASEVSGRMGVGDPGRTDLTRQPVLTIDPQGAKDHDDAIHVEREGEALRLWVHIADVSRYVPEGGAIDREAARRGNSVYLPGTVVPMLPHRLSSDLCSLLPGEERDAVTAELLVGADGEVSERRFGRSTILSRRRLTYPEVDAILDGVSTTPEIDASVRLAGELAERLRARRERQGALVVSTGEPRFVLRDGGVERVELETQTPSHSLVEQCMVAANEAVAEYLLARDRPTVFRYHEDPAGPPVERMYEQLEELAVPLTALPEGPLGPRAAREAAAAAAEAVTSHAATLDDPAAAQALSGLVLRSLRQAYYAFDKVGHSGLASAAYVHFTSPIRRYPDLLVHRGLLDALGIGPPGPEPSTAAEVSMNASGTERDASSLERRADSICAALFLEAQIASRQRDREVEGVVTGVIESGLFLAFDDVFDGFVPARRIGGDYWRLHPLEVGLVGESSGRRIMLGDRMTARIVRIEPLRGRVELEPVGVGPARQMARRSTSRSRSRRRR